MTNSRSFLYVALYLLFGTAALMTVRADQPALSSTKSEVGDGSPSRISDWAMAGVIWSDASLIEKLAKRAATQSESEDESREMSQLAADASTVIASLESFGWRQINRAGSKVTNRSQSSAAQSQPRIDTETPARRDDPGLDDERTAGPTPLDLDQYRVDDFIDETPREAANRADAVEDGIEGAIAAASPRGIAGPVAGRISEREVMTRSSTMAYSVDSIYDRDDYDPDIDYDVDNSAGVRSTNAESADLGDGDDDIDLDDPARVIDGEDELAASLARNDRVELAGTAPSVRGDSTNALSANSNLDRYTNQRAKFAYDANWVQFHLDSNQRLWDQISDGKNLDVALQTAQQQLRAHANVALNATDDESLSQVLRSVLAL